MLDNLAEDTTITATNDKNFLGIRVRVHGEVSDHLLVRELVALGALNDIVQDQDGAVIRRLEDQDILILALLVVENLLDLESHGLACSSRTTLGIVVVSSSFLVGAYPRLTGPHLRDLAEPAI